MNWLDAVDRTVTALGYELVDTERSARGLVRIYIDRVPATRYDTGPGEFVTVDDCEKVTRQLQHVLEVEGCAYERLEVSSPGLDRPLKKEGDFRRFAGEPVALTLKVPSGGRKRFQGRLLAPQKDDGAWRLLLADAPSKPAAAKAPRRGKRPAATQAPPPEADSAPASDPVLEFRLDEVRDAHLVPVVDFKGRRLVTDGPPSQPAAATLTDGETAQ